MKDKEVIEFTRWVINHRIYINGTCYNGGGVRPHKTYKKLLEEWKSNH